MFVFFDCWLRRYDHIRTNKDYDIIERVYFIFKLFIFFLSVHFHSCCFYVQYHGDIREISSIPV